MGLLCLTSFMSCNDSPILYKYVPADHFGWNATDTISILLDPNEVGKEDISITVGARTTDKYIYSDLLLKTTIKCGETVICDTKNAVNIYTEEGKAEGKIVTYAANFAKTPIKVKLDTDSTYSISITHLMKSDAIIGISDVGIKIE